MACTIRRPGKLRACLLALLAVSLVVPSAFGATRLQESSKYSSSNAPSSTSFVVSATTSTWTFHDSLSYPSISAMVTAGWAKCGTTDSTFYQISSGVLTLINNGTTASGMCWTKIPTGISNWQISTSTEYQGGSSPSIQLEVIAGAHDYRVLDIGGGYGVLMLLIDGNQVASIQSYIPPTGIFHLLGMKMSNKMVTVFSEGLAAFTYPANYADTSLSKIYLTGAWEAHDGYDYVRASQVDPNAADFSVGATPSESAVNSGQSATVTVSLASIDNFSKPVSLNAYQYQGKYKSVVNASATTVTPTTGQQSNSTITIATDQVLPTSSVYVIINATSESLP